MRYSRTCKILILPISIFFIILSFRPALSTEYGKIDLQLRDNSKDTVLKTANGGFIEFLENYANGAHGMWAQELTDRGLDVSDCGDFSWLCHWNRYTNSTRYIFDIVKMQRGGYNYNGDYFVEMNNLENEYSKIEQTVLISDTVAHEFYFYSKAYSGMDSVKIYISSPDGKTTYFEQKVIINDPNWKKYSLIIPAIPNVFSCNIGILHSSADTIAIDELSLMPTNNVMGIRAEYDKYFQFWKMGVLRYPGGCFADSQVAKWDNCLFPIDQRFSPGMMWDRYLQRQDLGVNEVTQYCKKMGIEPYFVVNFENGTPEYAANWVEYCNGDTNTVYGKKRAEMGYPEPFKVKYWEVGNEQWANPKEYAKRYITFYDAMKKVDSTIQIIIDGNHWTRENYDIIIPIVQAKCDIFGYHPARGYTAAMTGSIRDKFLCMIGNDNFETNVIAYYQNKMNFSANPAMKQAPTEWWSTYGEIAGGEWVKDTNYRNRSIEAALWNAVQAMYHYRNPKTVELSARTIGLGMVSKGTNAKGEKTIFATPSLYALGLLSQHIGKIVATNQINTGVYSISDINWWTPETKWLETLSTFDKDSVFIAVVNRHPEESLQTEIKINGIQYTGKNSIAYTLTSNHYLDNNSADNPEKILPTQSSFMFNGSYSFPKHSLTILAIPRDGISAVSSSPDDTHDFNVYPNPASEILCISKTNVFDTITRVNIINQLGLYVNDIIQTDNDSSLYLNIETLPKGVYYLEIHYDNKKVIKKFVKI